VDCDPFHSTARLDLETMVDTAHRALSYDQSLSYDQFPLSHLEAGASGVSRD